ncbi:MAG: NAD(+) diphosphatase [Deltaproteobacteria bacterium]|nr:NAD(+) diphosphatase [Deltaproteobacteria bacterium]
MADDIADIPVKLISFHYLGRLDGTYCFFGEMDPAAEIPRNMALHGLRRLYGALNEKLYALAGRAMHILDWDATYQMCSKCGNRLHEKENELLAKHCPICNQSYYLNPSPAVIVAVIKDDSILLAHANRFSGMFYSVIAGFVEPGEDLEACVKREVKEETNIDVKNVRYFGSQPWPYSHSLMIGFTAEYAGGSIKVDGEENSDAAWFKADSLPEQIPGELSIARKLIDWFIEQNIMRLPSSTIKS